MGEPINYQGNSNKKKAEEAGETPRPEIQKVIKGTAQQRKPSLGKRIAETFTGDPAQSVGEYILFDVVIPSIKTLFFDSFTQGLERSLFGTSSPRRGSGGGREKHTSYDKMYSGKPERRQLSSRDRAQHNFSDIIIETRAEAEEVLDHLGMLIDEYQTASINDLYEMVDITGTHADEKYGWTSLAGAGVRRVRDGYLLELPTPVWLE